METPCLLSTQDQRLRQGRTLDRGLDAVGGRAKNSAASGVWAKSERKKWEVDVRNVDNNGNQPLLW